MKYVSNERGVLPILVALLVVALLAVAGLAVYNVSKSHQKDSQVAQGSPSPSASLRAGASPASSPTLAPSDQNLITAALKANDAKKGPTPGPGSKYILCKLEGDYASVGSIQGTGGGGDLLLKKSQGVWSIAYDGQNLSEATASQLGFPAGFVNVCSSQSPVLFTY
jgi:hypothetical protein